MPYGWAPGNRSPRSPSDQRPRAVRLYDRLGTMAEHFTMLERLDSAVHAYNNTVGSLGAARVSSRPGAFATRGRPTGEIVQLSAIERATQEPVAPEPARRSA